LAKYKAIESLKL